MLCKPRYWRALDETRRDARHLAIGIRSSARSLQEGSDVSGNVRWRRSRPLYYFFRPPLSIVPLADKTAPILNRQIHRFIAHAESNILIATHRCCKHVETSHTSRYRKLLPTCDERICSATWTKEKRRVTIRDSLRQHLSR